MLAQQALADPRLPDRDRPIALWLLGRALHELDDVSAARTTLSSARSHANRTDQVKLAAEISVSLAICVMVDGETTTAVRLLDEAEPFLAGPALARLTMQRGLIELHRGELRTALARFDAAEGPLQAADDHIARCRLLMNRSVVYTNLNQLDQAIADLVACRRLARSLGLNLLSASAAHNLGYVSSRQGDAVAAFDSFDKARTEYELIEFPPRARAILELDVSNALLAAGLHREAIDAASRSVAAARLSGNQITLGDALLQRSLAEFSQSPGERAVDAASEASALFEASGRMPLQALSNYVAFRARSDRLKDRREVDSAISILRALDEHGWANEAQDVRIVVGRTAAGSGDHELAAAMLSKAMEARRWGPWPLRVGGWYATALARLGQGDTSGARRALRAGCRIVDDHQATLAATDLRAHATSHSSDLIDLGLQLAYSSGSSEHLLEWSERFHARSMRLTPVRPPRDGRLAGLLEDLRSAHALAAESASTGDRADEANAEIARIETEVRHASRTIGSTDPVTKHDGFRLDPAQRFRTHALVEFVRVEDQLVAIAAVHGEVTTHDLGSHSVPIELQHHALAALQRLAFGRGSKQSQAAARNGLAETVDELDQLLLTPLGIPETVPIVLVPTAELRGMPWSLLPTLNARPYALAPSASIWSRAPHTRSGTPRALLLAGPGLEHADDEVEQLAAVYDDATVLNSTEATVSRALDEMGEADVVHIAAHGQFRNDSPLFSSLQLADGPLTVYDIEQLESVPHTVVLSACDAGRLAVRGGELLGTAAALLHLGVSAVIAPVTAVHDESVMPLMVDLHRQLVAGDDPAAALNSIQTNVFAHTDDQVLAAAGSFVTLAADRSTPS